MSLLTKKQIEIITLIALNQSTSKDLYDELCEWNEKQQPAQFEPDWSKAPADATGAVLSLAWVVEGSWAFGGNIARFDKPAAPVTPHPHAEIMAKYAEVAHTRPDPWMEFEVKFEYGNWDRCTKSISFSFDGSYRHIGDNK